MALTHLLGTSALIQPPPPERFPGATMATSIICLSELRAGVPLARTEPIRAARARRLEQLGSAFDVLDVDAPVGERYAELRAVTGRGPTDDLWIAATASAHGLTLVTHDRRLAALPGVEALLL